MSVKPEGHHAHDGHAHEDHDGHDDHDDHHAEPPLPEPASPAWLPLLGGCLFVLGLLVFLLTQSDDEASTAAAEQGADSGAEVAEAPSPGSAAGERPAGAGTRDPGRAVEPRVRQVLPGRVQPSGAVPTREP